MPAPAGPVIAATTSKSNSWVLLRMRSVPLAARMKPQIPGKRDETLPSGALNIALRPCFRSSRQAIQPSTTRWRLWSTMLRMSNDQSDPSTDQIAATLASRTMAIAGSSHAICANRLNSLRTPIGVEEMPNRTAMQ